MKKQDSLPSKLKIILILSFIAATYQDCYLGPNCRECQFNSQCASHSDGHFCSGSGICCCNDDTECNNGLCNMNTNICVGPCSTSANCYGRQPICNTGTGTCIGCSVQNDCLPFSPKFFCASTGACVQCLNSVHCGGNTSQCNMATFSCVSCLEQSHCASNVSYPVCETSIFSCVECIAHNNCSAGTPICNTGNNKCQACSNNNDCINAHLDPICNTISGACVQCNSNMDCSGTTPICNNASQMCQPCAGNNDCAGLVNPVCNTNSGACVQCTANSDCNGNTPICNTATNRCQACTHNNNCTDISSGHVCDIGFGACVQCVGNSDCTALTKPICSSKLCIACQNNSQCSQITPNYLCNPTGSCNECLSHDNCTQPTKPICSSTSQTCVPCLSNTDCQIFDSAPVCNNSKGSCHECLTNSDCKTSGAPICAPNNTCVPCQNTTECQAINSSLLCHPQLGQCVDCIFDTNCFNPLKPICSNSTQQCRACQFDLECPSPQYCHLNTGRCQDCLSNTQCNEEPELAICDLFSGSCRGCQNNTDCTGNTRFCDKTTKICRTCLTNQHCSKNASFPVCNINTFQCEASEKEIEAVVATVTAAVAVTVAAAGPLVATNPNLLWNLMRIFQRFYYLQFCNIEFPENLKQFLAIFSIGKLSFLPNIGTISIFNDIDKTSPTNFKDNGYTGFYLESSGNMIFLWILLLIFLPIIMKLEQFLMRRYSVFRNKKIYQNYKTNFIPIAFDSTISDLFYGVSLQLINPPKHSFTLTISYLFAIATILVSIIVGVIKVRGIRRLTVVPLSTRQKWIPLFEYVVQILQPACMVFFYNYPIHQIAFLWAFNVAALSRYLDYASQYKKKIFLEAICSLMHLFITFLAYKTINSEAIGTIIICLSCLVVGFELVLMFIEEYRLIKTIIQYFKDKKYAKTRARFKRNKNLNRKVPKRMAFMRGKVIGHPEIFIDNSPVIQNKSIISEVHHNEEWKPQNDSWGLVELPKSSLFNRAIKRKVKNNH